MQIQVLRNHMSKCMFVVVILTWLESGDMRMVKDWVCNTTLIMSIISKDFKMSGANEVED